MTWHVITHIGDNAPARLPTDAEPSRVIEVRLDTLERPEYRGATVYGDLRCHPHEWMPIVTDLMTAAIAAYTADLRVPRKSAHDQWTREIHLHLSLNDPAPWVAATATFQQMLRFLTGDHWVVHVTPTAKTYVPVIPPRRTTVALTGTKVALFSGGLDSFIGALDLLKRGEQVILSGHYGTDRATSAAQNQAINALREHHRLDEVTLPYLRYSIAPTRTGNRAPEGTTRGRSLIFLATGVATAAAIGIQHLVVPENGFISLNVPLTSTRVGSFSTRTTHPWLIALFRQLLSQLGIPMTVELPYRFQTKGEMLARLDAAERESALAATMSCARPNASRYQTRVPFQHCGYCFPCLVRRAAAFPHDSTQQYWLEPGIALGERKGSDVRAVQMALAQRARREPTVFDVLKSGPLNRQEHGNFLGVHIRGLDELSRYLQALS